MDYLIHRNNEYFILNPEKQEWSSTHDTIKDACKQSRYFDNCWKDTSNDISTIEDWLKHDDTSKLLLAVPYIHSYNWLEENHPEVLI